MLIQIYILWKRQLIRYFRSRSRLIGSIAQPLLFLLALGFGFGPIYQKAGGGNYLQFLAPGIISMAIMTTAIFSGIEIIWDRQFGFLKETLVAPLSRFEIMLGRTLGGATVATIQGLIVFFFAALAGFKTNIFSLPLTLLFMFLIALLFCAIGTTIASLLTDIQGFQLIMNFLVMPLFFLSGALFPLENLPKIFVFISSIDPLSYGVDGLRAVLINNSHFGIFNDFLVLGIVTLIFLAIGSYTFSKMEI
jgi:ABC-2 type transport system permease protein